MPKRSPAAAGATLTDDAACVGGPLDRFWYRDTSWQALRAAAIAMGYPATDPAGDVLGYADSGDRIPNPDYPIVGRKWVWTSPEVQP